MLTQSSKHCALGLIGDTVGTVCIEDSSFRLLSAHGKQRGTLGYRFERAMNVLSRLSTASNLRLSILFRFFPSQICYHSVPGVSTRLLSHGFSAPYLSMVSGQFCSIRSAKIDQSRLAWLQVDHLNLLNPKHGLLFCSSARKADQLTGFADEWWA